MEETKPLLSEEMQMVTCSAKCPDCGSPLFYRVGQGIVFCWECVVNRENARRGRLALDRAKDAAETTRLEATDDDDYDGVPLI